MTSRRGIPVIRLAAGLGLAASVALACAALWVARGSARATPVAVDAWVADTREPPRTAGRLSPRGASAQPAARSERPGFDELAADALAHLPRVSRFREQSHEDGHDTPRAVVAMIQKLARIAQELHDRPELAEEGLRFYESCASAEDVFASIRALCLRDLEDRSRRAGDPPLVADARFPADVRRIAARIGAR